MRREEFLLNVLNVLTPVVSTPEQTINNGNVVKNIAKESATVLYTSVIEELDDILFPSTSSEQPGWDIEYTDKGYEKQDEWEQTLRKSISLLQKQLNDYLSK